MCVCVCVLCLGIIVLMQTFTLHLKKEPERDMKEETFCTYFIESRSVKQSDYS